MCCTADFTASSASSVSLTPVRTILCGCLQLSASLRDARHRLAATHAVWSLSYSFRHTQSKTMPLALSHNLAQLPRCRLARSVRITESLLLVPASSCYCWLSLVHSSVRLRRSAVARPFGHNCSPLRGFAVCMSPTVKALHFAHEWYADPISSHQPEPDEKSLWGVVGVKISPTPTRLFDMCYIIGGYI